MYSLNWLITASDIAPGGPGSPSKPFLPGALSPTAHPSDPVGPSSLRSPLIPTLWGPLYSHFILCNGSDDDAIKVAVGSGSGYVRLAGEMIGFTTWHNMFINK